MNNYKITLTDPTSGKERFIYTTSDSYATLTTQVADAVANNTCLTLPISGDGYVVISPVLLQTYLIYLEQY